MVDPVDDSIIKAFLVFPAAPAVHFATAKLPQLLHETELYIIARLLEILLQNKNVWQRYY
jgi:hypothetical protein